MIHGALLKACFATTVVLVGNLCVSQGFWPLLVKVTPVPLSTDLCGGLPLGKVRVKHSCWRRCCLFCCDPWFGGSGESWLPVRLLPVFIVGCSFCTCGVSWVNWSWRGWLQEQLLFSLMIRINFLHAQTQLCLKYCEWSVCLAAWDLLLGCGVKLAKPSLTNISTLRFLYLSTWMLLMGLQCDGWAHWWPFGSGQSCMGWWTLWHTRKSYGVWAWQVMAYILWLMYLLSALEWQNTVCIQPLNAQNFWNRRQQL